MGDARTGSGSPLVQSATARRIPGAPVTSDAGLLLPRELDERLGLSAQIEQHLSDPRSGHDHRFQLPDLFCQSIYSHLATVPSPSHWGEIRLLTTLWCSQ